ncbi:hypothetical protein C8Q80DRAFT_1163575 [Daedaleopsis nitida]|nr:hypothetical protein C8Q80DRAFT_1163575 [Daedaleopsis nitida]
MLGGEGETQRSSPWRAEAVRPMTSPFSHPCSTEPLRAPLLEAVPSPVVPQLLNLGSRFIRAQCSPRGAPTDTQSHRHRGHRSPSPVALASNWLETASATPLVVDLRSDAAGGNAAWNERDREPVGERARVFGSSIGQAFEGRLPPLAEAAKPGGDLDARTTAWRNATRPSEPVRILEKAAVRCTRIAQGQAVGLSLCASILRRPWVWMIHHSTGTHSRA